MSRENIFFCVNRSIYIVKVICIKHEERRAGTSAFVIGSVEEAL